MEFATILARDLRHPRVAQEWIEEGRQDGEAKVALRQLDRRCGPLSNATTALIKMLPLEKVEALAGGTARF